MLLLSCETNKERSVLYIDFTTNFAIMQSKFELSNKGGQLSSDAGLVLIKEFMEIIQFEDLLNTHVQFEDARKYHKFTQNNLFQQLLFQLIAGYRNDSATEILSNDPLFSQLLQATASQPTLSRFINSKQIQDNDMVHNLVERLAQLVIEEKNQQNMIIDGDSTHSDTFGKQESSDYNGHYNENGFHPLVFFESTTGVLLGAQLRPGNVYTSYQSEIWLERILKPYVAQGKNCLFRGDSGFAKPEIYDLCDKQGVKFVVRLKANPKLKKLAEGLVLYGDKTDITSEEVQWFSVKEYQPNTWNRPYRVVIKATRPAGELLFKHEFLVTNLEELSEKQIFPMYQKRGTMENFIKEAKHGFFFDKTDSSSFQANHFRMLLSSAAYNIIQLMKHLVLPETERSLTVSTIRFRFFRVAAKFVSHARKIQIQLSSSHVFQEIFWKILKNIHRLNLFSC